MSPIHRLLSTLLVLLVGASSVAAQTWRQIAPVDPAGWYMTPIALGGNSVMLVDKGGSFRRSDDGGVNWYLVSALDSLQVRSCGMLPDGVFWAACTDGTTVISDDTARTWTRNPSPVPRPDIVFNATMSADGAGAMNGFYDGVLWVTSDHGATWSEVDVPFASLYQSLHVVSTDLLYATAAGSNNIVRSRDLGRTWENIILGESAFIAYQVTGYADTVVVAGRTGTSVSIFLSDDGGERFTHVLTTAGAFEVLDAGRAGDIHLTVKKADGTRRHLVWMPGQRTFIETQLGADGADFTAVLFTGSLVAVDTWDGLIARVDAAGLLPRSFTRRDQRAIRRFVGDITYISTDSVLGVGGSHQLILSTDGGRTWADFAGRSAPSRQGLRSDSVGRLWSWGWSGVFYSTNQGIDWTEVTNERVAACGLVKDTVVWMDLQGHICRTGAPFTDTDTVYRGSPDADTSHAGDLTIHFLDDRRGAIVRRQAASDTSDQMEILMTTDAGSTWTAVYPAMPPLLMVDQRKAFLLESGEVLIGCRTRPYRGSARKFTVSKWDPVVDSLVPLDQDLADLFLDRGTERVFHDAIPTEDGRISFLVHLGCSVILEYDPASGTMNIASMLGARWDGFAVFSNAPEFAPLAAGLGGVLKRGQPSEPSPIRYRDSTLIVCSDDPITLSIQEEVDSARSEIVWRVDQGSGFTPPWTVIDSSRREVTLTTLVSGVVQAWVVFDDEVREIHEWTIYVSSNPEILGNGSICEDDTLVLSTIAIPDVQYRWRSDDLQIVGSDTESRVMVTSDKDGTYDLTLNVVRRDGTCADSTTITISVLLRPDLTIRGPDSVELYDRHFYRTDGLTEGSVRWSASDTSVQFLRGTDIPSALIQFIQTGTFSIYLHVTSANGCSTYDTLTVTVDSIATSVDEFPRDEYDVRVIDGHIVVQTVTPHDILWVDLVDPLGRRYQPALRRDGSTVHLEVGYLTGPIFVAVHTRSNGIITTKVLLP